VTTAACILRLPWGRSSFGAVIVSRTFLSHSSTNDAEAVALRDWLEREGWKDEIFFDLDPNRGIAAGERWERALHEHGSACGSSTTTCRLCIRPILTYPGRYSSATWSLAARTSIVCRQMSSRQSWLRRCARWIPIRVAERPAVIPAPTAWMLPGKGETAAVDQIRAGTFAFLSLGLLLSGR
jgi:hypothetical protein